jgi:hypothetical protein
MLSSPPNIMPSELASERTDGEHGDERNQLQRAPHNLAKVTVTGEMHPFLAKAYGRPIRVGRSFRNANQLLIVGRAISLA